MKDKFYTLVTNIGKSKIANAAATQDRLALKTIQVGDGNGNYYEPTEDQSKLKNKVWEGQISSITVDDTNPNWIKIDSLIPSKVGGFTIREVGIFDIEGDLILIAKYPETYKPQLEDGSVKDLTIRLIMEISNVDTVIMKIDPSVILATKKEVDAVEKRLNDKIDNLDLGEIEEKTYNELKKLKTSRKLVVGSYYILTDYKSKYLQPTSKEIKEGDIEKLILFAATEQDFSPQVYSMNYPKDVLYYDFNNNRCEDNSTPRNGFITYRHDTINNNSTYYDFRALKWIRYCPDKNQYYKDDALVNYEIWKGEKTKLDVVYKVKNQLLIADKIGVPDSETDEDYFTVVYEDIEVPLLSKDKVALPIISESKVALKKGDAEEVLTFHETCTDNSIAQDCENNVLWEQCHGNTINVNCKGNTLGFLSCHNSFNTGCENNALMMMAVNNVFGNSCSNNVLVNSSSENIFQNKCSNNLLGINTQANILNNNSSLNILTKGCNGNQFGNDCQNNTLGNDCKANQFGNSCQNNTFGNNGWNNTLGNNCWTNVLGDKCRANRLGDSCQNNVLGDNCWNNSFDNNCRTNKLGDSCQNNTLGNNCWNNILGDKGRYLIIKHLYNKNLTELDIYNKGYTLNIEKNYNEEYVYWYLDGNNSPVYNKIP